LRRIGWERAFDPSGADVWAAGEPRPRAGCELEILIDGAEALPRLADLTSYAGDRIDTSAHPARGGSQVTIFVGRFTG
jgi:hypothetical protein